MPSMTGGRKNVEYKSFCGSDPASSPDFFLYRAGCPRSGDQNPDADVAQPDVFAGPPNRRGTGGSLGGRHSYDGRPIFDGRCSAESLGLLLEQDEGPKYESTLSR